MAEEASATVTVRHENNRLPIGRPSLSLVVILVQRQVSYRSKTGRVGLDISDVDGFQLCPFCECDGFAIGGSTQSIPGEHVKPAHKPRLSQGPPRTKSCLHLPQTAAAVLVITQAIDQTPVGQPKEAKKVAGIRDRQYGRAGCS